MAITTTNQLRQNLNNNLALNSWQGITNIFSTLVQHTGKGKLFDPYQNPDGGDWNYIFNFLRRAHFHHESARACKATSIYVFHFLNNHFVVN